MVDVQTARREIVMQDDVIQTLPAARAAGALLNATPGLVVDNNGAALSPTMTFFNAQLEHDQFDARWPAKAV